MKVNKMMRIALALLLVTILSTCVVSGTFAKYTTTVSSGDSVRVASWGFKETTIDIDGLFEQPFEPGQKGEDSFRFVYDSETSDAPEEKYIFTVDTYGSNASKAVEVNKSIQWRLDDGEWVSFSGLLLAIRTLSGNGSGQETYGAGVLPPAFSNKQAHTIYWRWVFTDTCYYINEDIYFVDFVDGAKNARHYEAGDYLKQGAYDELLASGKAKITVNSPSVYYLCESNITTADYTESGEEYSAGSFITATEYESLREIGKSKVKVMSQNNLDTYIGEFDLKEVLLAITIKAVQADE